MSLKITREGIFDTVQDSGRWEHLHLGINPGGWMDAYSARLANALLGKELDQPVFEFHFPAATILFERATVITITGADFNPQVNNETLPLYHPVFLPAGSLLEFRSAVAGSCCYLALVHELELDQWLGSYSTNTRIEAGGFKGRKLKLNDRIRFKEKYSTFNLTQLTRLHWQAKDHVDLLQKEVNFIKGNEWNWLSAEGAETLQKTFFSLSPQSDRMGYRIEGNMLETKQQGQLISSPVSAGTMQLLPNGQLIILMADHQTTGGYPRIGHVTTATLPVLAQHNRGSFIKFKLVSLMEAEEKELAMSHYLEELQLTCNYKMKIFNDAHLRS